MPRSKIFNTLEWEEFESPPVFSAGDRKRFFSMPSSLENALVDLRTPTNKVCFLVAAGYFKARYRFFPRQFRPNDIAYVARQIGVDPLQIRIGAYSKESCARHQRMILSHFGFAPFDKAAGILAAGEITDLIEVQLRPKLVLLEILQILIRRKIETPNYNTLSSLIIAAINRQQRKLSQIITIGLSEEQRVRLDELLKKEPGEDESPGWRYRLTLLKKPFQSTRPSKIKANLARTDETPRI
jgi:hypothetical protein